MTRPVRPAARALRMFKASHGEREEQEHAAACQLPFFCLRFCFVNRSVNLHLGTLRRLSTSAGQRSRVGITRGPITALAFSFRWREKNPENVTQNK